MTDAVPAKPLSLPAPVRVRLAVECAALFFALPLFVAALVDPRQRLAPVLTSLGVDRVISLPVPIGGLVLPSLFAISLPLFIVLVLDPRFPTRRLWNAGAFVRDARRILLWFIPGGAALVVLTLALIGSGELSDRTLFALPRERPGIAIAIALLYPWLSCYPQEVSHRAFFFHRYGAILGDGPWMIAVNALAFSVLHAAFWNPWALAMTLVGGILFAYTYRRTRSTLAATAEHALYGWWAFMTGAGYFVYTGAVS